VERYYANSVRGGIEAGGPDPPLTRSRLEAAALIALTIAGLAVCILLAYPFLPAITWAIALALVAHPLHRKIRQRIVRPNLAAGLSVGIILAGFVAPVVLVGHQAAGQAERGLARLTELMGSGSLEKSAGQSPQTAAAFAWIERYVDIDRELKQLAESVPRNLERWLRGTLWTGVQFLVMLFLLFYLFRDRTAAREKLRSYAPLSRREADSVLTQVTAMIHATIYGTLGVASIQGTLGGLMFWALGLPSPLLWGIAMGLLSIITGLGAFVIWLPAATMLALQGDWAKAALLTAWGTVVVGLIDNLLYPIFVGREMRLHTVPVFIAILGGLFVFGASGLVLGPAALALTISLLDVLLRRTENGGSAQDPS
jgi:predicted PurR-regulated permease PerM